MKKNAVIFCDRMQKEKQIRLIKTDLPNIFTKRNSYAADESGNITGLNVSGQTLEDAAFLKDCRTLQCLDLSNNMIADISMLAHLKNLTELDLSQNRIADISCLRDLKKLTYLDLKSNRISSLPGDILEWGMEIKWESENPTDIILAGNPLEEPLRQAIENGRKALIEYFGYNPEEEIEIEIPPDDSCFRKRRFTMGDANQPVFNIGNGSTGNIFVGRDLNWKNPGVVNKEYDRDQVKKILVLSANPKDTGRLRLDEEVREIEEGLRRSRYRDRFEIHSRWAVRPRDIQRAMLDYEPHIVHFSGHGTGEGLMVEDKSGRAVLVSPKALSELFKLCSDQVECVVMNACYSARQAAAISKHIRYVIGMRKDIDDKAAIEFAVGFYDALGAGKSVEQAFEFGCNGIRLYNLPGHLNPVLKKREG